MKNYVQEGDILTLTAPYAVSSGGGALIGSIFGISVTDLASGSVGSFRLEGVFTHSKATGAGTGGTQGAKAYWNNTSKVFTAVASGNTLVGVFTKTCADADVICEVRLNGSF